MTERPKIAPCGMPLTEEESSIICTRHPMSPSAILTPSDEILADTWPTGKNAETVMRYATGVATGEICAGADLMLGAIRFLRMLKNPAYDVNTRDAEFVIKIAEGVTKHRQGQDQFGRSLRGKSLKLEPWEKFIIYGILIFFEAGKPIRLVDEAFIFIPRKNGKTAFVSALTLALAILERTSGAKVYVVGASLKQARETFDNWKYSITTAYGSPDRAEKSGWRILDNNNEHSVSHEHIGGGSVSVNALAANPDKQDSLNGNIIVADEMHAYKSPKQYSIMKQATIAYVNKLMCGITTAGDDPVSPCAQRVEMCRKVLRGLIHNDRLFIFMCSMDKSESGDVDILNPWQHQKSNPNYGVTVRPEEIMAAAQEAINDPQMRKEFLTRRGNIFVSSMRAYFDLDMFRTSNRIAEQKLGIDASWTLEQKINHLAKIPHLHWYGGADLSKLHDLTTSALYASVNEEIAVIIPHCWFPIVAAHEKADQDNIPLFGWKDDGWLDMVNAPTNNPKMVVDWFVDMKKRGFRITEIGIDRKFAEQFFVGLKEKGFRAEDQPQLYHLKTVGFRAIETAARNNNLYYLGAEPFEYCVSNVQAIEKTDDMIIFDKIKPTQRIDVFDAAVFAACKAMKSYERRVKSGS